MKGGFRQKRHKRWLSAKKGLKVRLSAKKGLKVRLPAKKDIKVAFRQERHKGGFPHLKD